MYTEACSGVQWEEKLPSWLYHLYILSNCIMIQASLVPLLPYSFRFDISLLDTYTRIDKKFCKIGCKEITHGLRTPISLVYYG